MKKTISLLCLITICICMFPSAVFAESAEKQSGDWTYTIMFDDSAQITKYTGTDSKITIPSELDGHPVSTLAEYCFGQFLVDNNYQEIIIPEGVTEIDNMSFIYATSLRRISIPKTVVRIGRNIFAESVREIIVAEGNPYYSVIDGVLFETGTKTLKFYPRTKSEKTYEIPQGTRGIDNCAFMYNNYLEIISIPDGMQTIGSNAFGKCNNLKEIILPESVSSIEKHAFSNCTNLKRVVIPGLPYMGEDIFNKTTNVTVAVCKDSAIERYCKENGVRYVYIGEDNESKCLSITADDMVKQLNKRFSEEELRYSCSMGYSSDGGIGIILERYNTRVGTILLYGEDGNNVNKSQRSENSIYQIFFSNSDDSIGDDDFVRILCVLISVVDNTLSDNGALRLLSDLIDNCTENGFYGSVERNGIEHSMLGTIYSVKKV